MKSRAFRALMTAKLHGECSPLTDDESAGLGLAVDLQLVTLDSDIRPGGKIQLSLLGEALLGQLSDVARQELREVWDERLASLRAPGAADKLIALSNREDPEDEEPPAAPAPGM